jgi:hypothetical protein
VSSTGTAYTRIPRPRTMVDSYGFHAVYRLVDSWQEIGEYQQLTLRREPSYKLNGDWEPEESRREKHKLLGDHATKR